MTTAAATKTNLNDIQETKTTTQSAHKNDNEKSNLYPLNHSEVKIYVK